MDELIKAFANDVRTIKEHRAELTPFSNMEVCLYGKETMAKIALGRTLLVNSGLDPTNVEKAIVIANAYLSEYLKENA